MDESKTCNRDTIRNVLVDEARQCLDRSERWGLAPLTGAVEYAKLVEIHRIALRLKVNMPERMG